MKQNWLCTEAVIQKFSVKEVSLENLRNSQKKHLFQSVFFNKVANLHPVALFENIFLHSCTGVFKNTFLREHLRATASKIMPPTRNYLVS